MKEPWAGTVPSRGDRIAFRIGWGIAAVGVVVLILYHTVPAVRENFGLPYRCAFREVTGLYCPGCGMTRAVKALLEGQLWRSFLYHPALLYGAVWLAVFLASQTLGQLSRGKLRVLHIRPVYVYILVGILLVQWIVKNTVLLR